MALLPMAYLQLLQAVLMVHPPHHAQLQAVEVPLHSALILPPTPPQEPEDLLPMEELDLQRR
jgi:hypothetical protein